MKQEVVEHSVYFLNHLGKKRSKEVDSHLLKLALCSSHTNDFDGKDNTVYFINQIFWEENANI